MRWAAVIGAVTAALWAAQAQAGTYDVYGCRLPDGTTIAIDGWEPYAPSPGTYATNGCPIRSGLSAGLDQSATLLNETHAAWTFDAPADVTIGAYELYR